MTGVQTCALPILSAIAQNFGGYTSNAWAGLLCILRHLFTSFCLLNVCYLARVDGLSGCASCRTVTHSGLDLNAVSNSSSSSLNADFACCHGTSPPLLLIWANGTHYKQRVKLALGNLPADYTSLPFYIFFVISCREYWPIGPDVIMISYFFCDIPL